MKQIEQALWCPRTECNFKWGFIYSFPLPECPKVAAGQVLLQVNVKSRVSPRWELLELLDPKTTVKFINICLQHRSSNIPPVSSLDFLPAPLICLKLWENEWENVDSRASNTLSSESLFQQVGNPAFSRLDESGPNPQASPWNQTLTGQLLG